eukprot:SM000090S24300  [mRNA]  locus=s90:109508:112903:- [translate_table: standard]
MVLRAGVRKAPSPTSVVDEERQRGRSSVPLAGGDEEEATGPSGRRRPPRAGPNRIKAQFTPEEQSRALSYQLLLSDERSRQPEGKSAGASLSPRRPRSSREFRWHQHDAPKAGDEQQARGLHTEDGKHISNHRHKYTGLVLLNVLAALYGSNTVAARYVEEVAPFTPASLSSAVRFVSAAIFFAPAIRPAWMRRNKALLRAGVELGVLSFFGTVVANLGSRAESAGNASLMYIFTVVFVPLMEFCTGKPVNKLTWLATFAALIGMGLLEEEGQGWTGVPLPRVADLWTILCSILSAAHVFRSEALGTRFNLLDLTAIQVAVLACMGLFWEAWTLASSGSGVSTLHSQLQGLPWAPILYSGLACAGLCNWLELQGLRNVHASTATLIYTTIPIWGAFFTFLLSGDTPGPSVLLGFLVIISASFLAQATSPADETQTPPVPDVALQVHEAETKEPQEPSKGLTEHFPAALLSSQLKFPFYAAQAQRLMAEVKLKVAALKALVISAEATITGNVLSSPPGQLPPSPGLANSAAGHISSAAVHLMAAVGTSLSSLSSWTASLPHSESIARTVAAGVDVTSMIALVATGFVHCTEAVGAFVISLAPAAETAAGGAALISSAAEAVSAAAESSAIAAGASTAEAAAEAESISETVAHIVYSGADTGAAATEALLSSWSTAWQTMASEAAAETQAAGHATGAAAEAAEAALGEAVHGGVGSTLKSGESVVNHVSAIAHTVTDKVSHTAADAAHALLQVTRHLPPLGVTHISDIFQAVEGMTREGSSGDLTSLGSLCIVGPELVRHL